MSRIFGVLTFVLLLLPPPAAGQTWAEYRPEGAGYTIELPGEWIVTGRDIDTAAGAVETRMATVLAGQRIYASMHGPYPDGIVGAGAVTRILDGVRDGVVGSLRGRLRAEQRILIGSLPARHLIIDKPDRAVIVARFLLIGNTLVQAMVIGPPGVEAEADTKRCLESLKVVKAARLDRSPAKSAAAAYPR